MKHCLSDIRVLEIGQILAAPYAGMMLGDLGADVIKIESPDGGDNSRKTPPHFYKGESIYFMALNRNKRSFAIDLKTEDGLRVFYDLVEKSDVVIDNLRCGLRETLKIDHETLLGYNDKIISCSINGFGSNTPDCAKPSFDLMVQAKGGGISLTGEPGGPPVRMGVSITDYVAGVYAVTGVLAALHERQHTKKGKKLEVPLLSTMISLLGYEATLYLYSGDIPCPVGCGHRSLVPYNAVSTKDGHIVIGAHLPKFWSSLCEVLGIEDIGNDPKFNSLEVRNRNRGEILEILNERFSRKTSREWIEVLDAKGVPCAPINDIRAALSDPTTQALNMVVDVEHKGVGLTFKTPGNPIRTFEEDGQQYLSPPLLGEHTQEVLREILHYPEELIDDLIQKQTVSVSSASRCK